MCQLTDKNKFKVEILEKPMTVYKLAEYSRRIWSRSKLRAYYQQTSIELGKTMTKFCAEDFAQKVAKADPQFDGSYIRLDEQGIHACPNKRDVEVTKSTTFPRIDPAWTMVVLECVIPKGSAIVRGVWSDWKDVRTIVTNRIKYVRILKD